MACFTLDFLKNLLVWLVVVFAIVAVVQLVVPKLLSLFGVAPDGGIVMTILRIVVWALVLIAAIYFVFDLIACAFGGGFPRLR